MGSVGNEGQAVYSASKAGLLGASWAHVFTCIQRHDTHQHHTPAPHLSCFSRAHTLACMHARTHARAQVLTDTGVRRSAQA